MKKVKFALLSVSLLFLAAGTTIASKSIADGWYEPDYTLGATPSQDEPNNCPGGQVVCATHYTNGSADDQLFKAQ